jgi:hypothetical protein
MVIGGTETGGTVTIGGAGGATVGGSIGPVVGGGGAQYPAVDAESTANASIYIKMGLL